MSLSSQFSSDHSLSIVLSLQPTGQFVLKPRPGPGLGLGISVGLVLSVLFPTISYKLSSRRPELLRVQRILYDYRW